VDALLNDIRYTVRRLLASPGFAFAAVATMALGIGANSAIFSVINAVMLRPMPVERADQLVDIYTTGSDGIPATSSYPDYLDLRDQPMFDGGIAAYEATLLNVLDQGRSTVVFGEAVSGNYFAVLGLRPVVGRLLEVADDRPAASPVAVIGHKYWQRQFGGNPKALGQPLVLNGKTVTIVGIAPKEYTGAFNAIAMDVWIPQHVDFAMSPQRNQSAYGADARGRRSLFLRARLASGVAVAQVQAALDVATSRLATAYPATNSRRAMHVYRSADVRFHPEVDSYLAPIATVLMAVPALVLLIACANVANLLLARGSARSREIALRQAVGAGRSRLIQQLLTESVMLSVLGGASGLLLAWWLLRAAEGWQPDGLPIPLTLNLSLDARVVSFTAVVSMLTGVLFGIVPALQATRPGLFAALKDEQPPLLRGYRRFGTRNALVVAQLAVSLVLLTGAGLFVRSLQRAQDIDPGFERQHAIILTPMLEMSTVPESQRAIVTEQLRQRLSAIPGVQGVALADRVPLGASVRNEDVVVDDQQPDERGLGTDVDVTTVGPGYFAVLGIPLIRGRDFNDRDVAGSPKVAIVSAAMAERLWPGVDPIGRQIRFPPRGGRPQAAALTVIAVARDTKVRTLGEAPRPYLYMASLQDDSNDGYVIRTAADPAPLVPIIRREALALNPELPILELKTMREHLSLMLTPPRLAAAALGVFGTLAVLLASLGLYAVVAFSVVRRTKEIGIRVALGATRRQIMRLVVSEGMALVAVGIAVGFVLAAVATRPLGAYLYGLNSFDPVTFASVAALLAGTALLANYLPARRALRVDPLKAIRYE
jgi:macrolide transport system ATP-binding/permease protein